MKSKVIDDLESCGLVLFAIPKSALALFALTQ